MSEDLTFLVGPEEWGATGRYNSKTNRMSLGLSVGSKVPIELCMNISEVLYMAFQVIPSDEWDRRKQFIHLYESGNLYWFTGTVERALHPQRRKSRLAITVDCGFPLVLGGVYPPSEHHVECRIGDVVSGLGHLEGTLSRPRYWNRFPVNGTITGIRELASVPSKAFQPGFRFVRARIEPSVVFESHKRGRSSGRRAERVLPTADR